MVFPSFPVYLDPPNNWNQQQSHQQYPGGGGGGTANQLLPPPEAGGAVHPGFMAEQARLAKLPQPEQGLKCPRCDSSNTKFCYFNNYSLSQPRHFCKTCRRYWTRGGGLRNVPVGGGCRRNKRSKPSASSSKSASAIAGDHRQAATGTSSSASKPACGAGSNMQPPPPPPPPVSHLFMSSLNPLGDYGGASANLGLGFTGIQPIDSLDFQIGGFEEWRVQQTRQQFPFLAGLDPAQPAPPPAATQPAAVSALFPFDDCAAAATGDNLPKTSHGLSNSTRQYLGFHGNDDHQFWGASGGGSSGSAAGWPGNLSNFMNSSS